MRFDRPPSDGQPEPRPTEIPRSGSVDSIEAIEDVVTMLGWNARPVSTTSMVGPRPPFRTTIRTLPPGGVYLTALSTRLMSAGRITRRSTDAGTGSGASTVTDWCFSSASTPGWAATSRASSARSTPSRLSDTLPPSARESVRSPSTRRPSRSVSSSMLPMISRYAAASRCSRRPTSPTLRIAVSGVRSSCEASAVKRRSCSNDRSSRANASLNTSASCPSSSPGFSTGSRSPSRSAVIVRARSAMRPRGASTRRARR